MKRNHAIDYEKGIIVAVMVLCHVLQFFGKPDLHPEQYTIMLVINFTAFQTFVFAYGRSVAAAYFSRTWKQAAPRMLKSALRSYVAFCISGVSYLVLCEDKGFSSKLVMRVLTFDAVPGWSEFLAAFAALGVVALILFPLLKKIVDRGVLLAVLSVICFAGVLIPYGMVGNNVLGLFIGTDRFSCFPVLQYMPFFLAGLYVGVHGMPKWKLWAVVSVVLSGAAIAWLLIFGEPRRFPPTLMWILLPCALIVLLDRLSELADRAAEKRNWIEKILAPVGSMGMNSLFYLLASNMIIFSVSRMGTMPVFRKSEVFPFSLEQGCTAWALFWTVAMLAGIGYMTTITRRARK